VVPYIGDLIGYRPLNGTSPNVSSPRADVANTIGYRRRKGTLGVIEKLAYDVTGWPAIAVEFFTVLATAQYIRHLRPDNARIDVRSWRTATDIGSAFDEAPRSVEVRRIASRRGRYNIPDIGVFVWQLAPFGSATLHQVPPGNLGATPMVSTAKRISAGAYTFDPFGDDVPLVNPPLAPDTTFFKLLQRRNVPELLRRRILYDELTTLQQDPNAVPIYFGWPPVFTVSDANGTALTTKQIAICNLATWSAPTAPGIVAAIDPELGRIRFAAPAPAAGKVIAVSYAYAFSGPFGGGSYARQPDAGEAAPDPQSGFTTMVTADFSTLTKGVHEITDSGTHPGDAALSPAVANPPAPLVLRAANYARPIIDGKLTINAVAGTAVALRGLGITGDIEVKGAGSFTLQLEHCTVRGTVKWNTTGGGALVIDHCLCGPLAIDPDVAITITDSAVDGGADGNSVIAGIGGACGALSILRGTVIGTINAREIELIENSIVTGLITCGRQQQGCIRYSYLPGGSATPPSFRCQPRTAIDDAVAEANSSGPPLTKAQYDALVASISAALIPLFTSRAHNKPGYLQLADPCPQEITQGAEGGGEMGIFNSLETSRREANLVYRLREYLRIGLESGVIHAS